ncbi:MAG TPA: hypothetical protein VFK57_25355 [Vicinamibacterales bacterium]|nr:hypothetical protein [Vicinamibacterales bacterium]
MLWRLKRAFESAAGHPVEGGLVALLRRLGDLDEPVRSSILNAVRTLEMLVQAAEQRHAGERGRGADKKREVVAAATRLIGQPFPDVIHGADPGLRRIVEAFCGMVVDLIVGLLNANGLWTIPPAAPAPVSVVTRFLRWLLGWMIRALSFLLALAVRARLRLAGFDDELLRGIPAELVRALQRSLTALRAMLAELSAHQRELAGFIQAVAVAVQEAETWVGTPGIEKQAHARRLIALFLHELRVPAPAPLIEIAIDAVVDIFNRRGFFVHRSLTA